MDATLQFMKTRSSAGVGQKVDLAFDMSGLRITDLEDEDVKTEAQETSALYNKTQNVKQWQMQMQI